MSFYSAKKKIKNIAAFLIILIFLPYVVSIFVNGKDVNLQNGSGHFTIKGRGAAYKPVQRTGRKRGEDGNREISDSCRNETEMGSGQF